MAQHTIRLIAQRDNRDGRQTWESLNEMGEEVLTVRARSPRALLRVAREARLLRQLNHEGVSAAPRLFVCRPWGYTIESARSVQPARGRRASESVRSMHSSGEGALAASARADLDQLCEELNARELALGLRSPAAIGMRSDSSVVVTDFSGLCPATFASQRADARWISAAIGNAPARQPSHVQRQRSALIETEIPQPSRGPWLIAAGVLAATAVLTGAGMFLIGGVAGSHTGERAAEEMVKSESPQGEPAAAATEARDAVSAPALLSELPEMTKRPASATSGETVHELGLVNLATGDDAADMLTALADQRRDYVIGAHQQNRASAPGTEAWTADTALRQQLSGLLVSGGVTTVHEAQVVVSDGATAQVRAVISESPITVTGPNHSVHTIPATAKRTVLITLTRTDGGWRVSAVQRV